MDAMLKSLICFAVSTGMSDLLCLRSVPCKHVKAKSAVSSICSL
ncbi:hypothetical protein F383_38434 [Gossypium arboreum]|uniref:Uncharacterized protein n=1 Tax=Gossypium arboreum TaxID=29729 RepID=A0A0B0MG32_GOSAR|nr:hypothetical protein F383_38434 [Gossypium arboreum]